MYVYNLFIFVLWTKGRQWKAEELRINEGNWKAVAISSTPANLGREDAQSFCLHSQALVNKTQALVARKYHLVNL